MVIKYVVSPYPSLTENLYARIWEAETDGPGAHVWEQLLPAPHTLPVTIIANGLDKVVHIVRLIGAISGQVYHDYNEEPQENVVEMFDPIKFRIGDGQPTTPTALTDKFSHPALLNQGDEDYLVFRNGFGYLFPNVGYTTQPVDPLDSTKGSFTLMGGDLFGPQDEFIITKKYKTISNPVHDSVVGKLFGGFVDVAAPTVWSSVHLRKLIRFAGNTTYEFPAGQAIPIGYIHVFSHLGAYPGAAGKGIILFNNFPLRWGNATKNTLDVVSFSEVAVTFDGAFWNVAWMCDTSFVNASAPAAGKIIGYGTFLITRAGFTNGDIPGGDNYWTVQHNLNIQGDYMVFLQVKGNATGNPAPNYGNNNTVTHCWWHDDTVEKKNRFHFSAQEISPQAQNVSLNWMIVKL